MHNIFKVCFIAVLSFIEPIQAIIFLVFGMTIIDLITGIWASIKTGKKIESRIMRRSVVKILAYEIAILSAYWAEAVFFPGSIILTKIVASATVLIEFSSLMENLTKITGIPVFMKIYEMFATYFNRNKEVFSSIDKTMDTSVNDNKEEDKEI